MKLGKQFEAAVSEYLAREENLHKEGGENKDVDMEGEEEKVMVEVAENQKKTQVPPVIVPTQ